LEQVLLERFLLDDRVKKMLALLFLLGDRDRTVLVCEKYSRHSSSIFARTSNSSLNSARSSAVTPFSTSTSARDHFAFRRLDLGRRFVLGNLFEKRFCCSSSAPASATPASAPAANEGSAAAAAPKSAAATSAELDVTRTCHLYLFLSANGSL